MTVKPITGQGVSDPLPALSAAETDTSSTTTEDATAPKPGGGHAVSGQADNAHAIQAGFWTLTLGAIGVVFGDIGTSPLYAMREALLHARPGGELHLAAFGVISLVFWALLLLVTVKYVIFLMRADNRAEGGTLALMALVQKAMGRTSPVILLLGTAAAALFYGDSLITPALSILGALEGFKDAPLIGSSLDEFIMPAAIVLLVGLFAVQSRGTAKVARFFGPIVLVWFAALAAMGVWQIARRPDILLALSPHYGLQFLMDNGFTGFVILGAIFLVVTGAEALYADMGHFGRKPIRTGWLWIVFPALMLNYLGQGALVLADPAAVANPFWRMVPELFYWPVMLLATLATIIASQAVITGAFSMTQQAVQLGLLPRMDIRQTSETVAGQIYIPRINLFLAIGVILLIVLFKTSGALTSAYGIAVTGTMLISTVMAYIVLRRIWLWSRWRVLALLVPLGLLETVFLASNLTKFLHGAWMPMALGGLLVAVMITWKRGTQIVADKTRKESVSLSDLMVMLERKPPNRAPGTAIFMTAEPDVAPGALMHNLKHNRTLHERNILLTVRTVTMPRVDDAQRIAIEVLNADFTRLTVTFGFMENPDLPRALALSRKQGLKFDIMSTTFFLGRRSYVPGVRSDMPKWQKRLFILLSNNAASPTAYFRIPPGRVVELGTQISV